MKAQRNRDNAKNEITLKIEMIIKIKIDEETKKQ